MSNCELDTLSFKSATESSVHVMHCSSCLENLSVNELTPYRGELMVIVDLAAHYLKITMSDSALKILEVEQIHLQVEASDAKN